MLDPNVVSRFASGILILLTSSPIDPVYAGSTTQDFSQCFTIQPKREISIPQFVGTKVFWIETAGDNCPSSAFPLLQVVNPKVQNWIQVVETNLDLSPAGTKDSSWNIFPGEKTFTFIDVSEDFRKQHKVYSNHGESDTFMDNPKATVGPKTFLSWVAHLYGMRDSEVSETSGVVGIEWGYQLQGNQVTALSPKPVTREQIKKDFLGIIKYLEKFSPKNKPSNAH